MKKIIIILGCMFLAISKGWSQVSPEENLRANLNQFRSNYDVTYYELEVKVIPQTQSLEGTVTMHFQTLENLLRLQVDLDQNLEVSTITYQKHKLAFKRQDRAIFVDFLEPIPKGELASIRIEYKGRPPMTQNAPQQGGFDWRQNLSGKDWIAVSPQQTGGSGWWPCKDHISDQADSMRIKIAVPKELIAVSNGRLTSVLKNRSDGFWSYQWKVSEPIQTTNVMLSISNYVLIKDTYESDEYGNLELSYYVLPTNEAKARTHFKQVKTILRTYERILGKYPFWRDGYTVVDTPFQGVYAHGLIPYANFYRNIPEQNVDYTLLHGTASQYFGNSISNENEAALWIPEAFSTYAEALFIERRKSYVDALEYLKKYRKNIKNAAPLASLSPTVQIRSDQDPAYKGAWIIHTLRKIVNDDSAWYALMRDIPQHFAHQLITNEALVRYLNQQSGIDCTPFFNHYLFQLDPPVFEFMAVDNPRRYKLTYRWRSRVPGFKMPMRVTFGDRYQTLYPTQEWQTITLPKQDGQKFVLDMDRFYVFGNHLPLPD
ncbi:M1 family metallopeptidase [Siphonobacter sp. SORGH_AS_1065]|uniref:M1 family metallopeptidase n=1 Tax=Siphonobacter sp. SORGH_AS_1065 TaxID=3041795 RepID=UPI00278680BF|nr:M1 family metallopeptidase [Siphonobacter sp. SORGH_AS_1065]MDQ1088231.1 aminopeptidase N [Siphonobacter sp. SORGH_AS_1065]